LWSLAVVAYEMLAGAHPFTGETSLDIHRAMLAENFTPLAAHLPSAPPHWQEFFSSAFSSDKHRRPASASAFFSALESALAHAAPAAN
jgi:serine/threonine-protein kinase